MAMSSFRAMPAMSIVVPMRPHPMIAICTLLLGAVAPNTLAGTTTGAAPAASTPFRNPLLPVFICSLLSVRGVYVRLVSAPTKPAAPGC